MMALNNNNGPSRILTTNGSILNDCQSSLLPTEENIEFGKKVAAQCVYIGKLKNEISSVEIRNDRIVFSSITNGSKNNKARFNITLPYIEIIALRYCFERDISIFVIQPIFESYEKLSKWSNAISVNRFIPENFIMIKFSGAIESELFEKMKSSAMTMNRDIKIIRINVMFARAYLNTPNKGNNVRPTQKPSSTTHEVILLDDDGDCSDKAENILDRVILKYPENEPNSILLCGHDLNCIRDGQYLNDNIMNFYLKFFQYNGSHLNRELLDKIFIYDVLFSSKLLSTPRKRKHHMDLKGYLIYTQDTFGDIYQRTLKQWTKDIDIFSKDFLLIPIVKDFHWFLVILCHIGNLIPSQSNGQLMNSHEGPTIIIMDSLNNNVPRNEIIKTIVKYLQYEYKEKRHASESLDFGSLRELFPKVPMQQNFYDCGLFVLEYIERFLGNPEKVLRAIEKDTTSLSKWFEASSLNTKRAKIKQIILNLLPPEDAVKLEHELDKKAQEDDRPASPPPFLKELL